MLTGIDHIVIVVDDLDAASASFAAAGFTVTPGGSHPTGTYNTLVPFADGSYLELIAIEKPELAADHPWFRKMAGKQGFVTFAVGADPLDYELARLASLGISPANQRAGGRLRPDGQQLQWKSSDLATDPPVFLPFLIQDVTDRALRVPGGPEAAHANGVKGTTGLTVVTDDLQRTMDAYGKLFSAPVAALDHDSSGTQAGWRYFIGRHWVDLVQPADDSSPASVHLATYGPGISQLFLTVATGPEFPASRIDIAGFPDLCILTTN